MNQHPNVVLVNTRQRGNPILKYIRNVMWQYAADADGGVGGVGVGDADANTDVNTNTSGAGAAIVADYVMGQSVVGLFLSLRYHLLKPDYIYSRMKALKGGSYRLKVLIVQVDTEDARVPLGQVMKGAIGNDFTLFCGFTPAECGRYIETLKSYEKKPAESIQKDLGSDYGSRVTSVLTAVRGVNRTDAKTLVDEFGSLGGALQATLVQLQACPGIGPTKARRLYEA